MLSFEAEHPGQVNLITNGAFFFFFFHELIAFNMTSLPFLAREQLLRRES